MESFRQLQCLANISGMIRHLPHHGCPYFGAVAPHPASSNLSSRPGQCTNRISSFRFISPQTLRVPFIIQMIPHSKSIKYYDRCIFSVSILPGVLQGFPHTAIVILHEHSPFPAPNTLPQLLILVVFCLHRFPAHHGTCMGSPSTVGTLA